MGCHFLLQGIFLIQGLNLGLLHCRQVLHRLNQGTVYCNSQERAVEGKFLSANSLQSAVLFWSRFIQWFIPPWNRKICHLERLGSHWKIQSSHQLGRVGSESWSCTKEPTAQSLPTLTSEIFPIPAPPSLAASCRGFKITGIIQHFWGHVIENISSRLKPGTQWGKPSFSGGIQLEDSFTLRVESQRKSCLALSASALLIFHFD